MAAAHPQNRCRVVGYLNIELALSALFHLFVCFGFLSPELKLQLGFITDHKGSERMVFKVIRGINQQWNN